MDEHISEEELKAHEAFLEKLGAETPSRSCDMIRAWMKLNIESFLAPVWNN